MRIALLFSGLPRMWRHCFETQRRLFENAEVEVFFHFWDVIDAAEKREILDTMRPRAYAFEPPVDFSFVDRYGWLRTDTINVPSRMVSQYTSWRRVATMFIPHLPRYDLAVRTRSDLFMFAPISYDLANVTDGDISLLLYHWPGDQRFFTDLFSLGRPQAIVYFCSLLDRMWQYARELPFSPEVLITQHVVAASSHLGDFKAFTMTDLPFFVFRPHMAEWSAERRLTEGPTASKWHDPEVAAAHSAYHAAKHDDAGTAHVQSFAQDDFEREAALRFN